MFSMQFTFTYYSIHYTDNIHFYNLTVLFTQNVNHKFYVY